MTRRGWTLLVAAGLAAGLLLGGLAMPVPYVALSPGPVTDTLGEMDGKPLIVVVGHRTYPSSGRLDLTTVEETSGLDMGSALRSWLSSEDAVIPEEAIKPPGQTDEQLKQETTQQMLDSQTAATDAALHQLGVKPISTQVVVVALTANSPSAGKLAAGDQLVSVNGTAVTSNGQLRSLIGGTRPGSAVQVAYRRAGKQATTEIVTAEVDGRSVIGVLSQEKNTYPFTVRIQLNSVGGPSAGLMFALGIVDKLTPGDLTGGKTIAGTGTITPTGVVGPIGGITQKLLGARQKGATVFLVPAGNCNEARQATPAGLTLVKTATLSDAVDELTRLRGGATNLPGC